MHDQRSLFPYDNLSIAGFQKHSFRQDRSWVSEWKLRCSVCNVLPSEAIFPTYFKVNLDCYSAWWGASSTCTEGSILSADFWSMLQMWWLNHVYGVAKIGEVDHKIEMVLLVVMSSLVIRRVRMATMSLELHLTALHMTMTMTVKRHRHQKLKRLL